MPRPKGYKMSPESRAKTAASRTGQRHSAETKAKIAAAMSNNTNQSPLANAAVLVEGFVSKNELIAQLRDALVDPQFAAHLPAVEAALAKAENELAALVAKAKAKVTASA